MAGRRRHLSEAQEDAVLLRRFRGETCSEIARDLGVSDTMISSAATRARRRQAEQNGRTHAVIRGW
jgi:DNA-directed RNA polymerase specialized sigma24 family protein